MGIVEAGLMNVQHRRTNAQLSTEAARAEFHIWSTGLLQRIRDSNFGGIPSKHPPPTLEAPEIIGRLRDFPSRQRQKEWKNPLLEFVLSWCRNGINALRFSIPAVALAKNIVLC